MRLSILDISDEIAYWLALRIGKFSFYLATEKWWSHGYEHIIGMRFGDRYFEKRFNSV